MENVAQQRMSEKEYKEKPRSFRDNYVVFIMEAPPRFELGIKVLQTSALPLGYGAIRRPYSIKNNALSG